MKRQPEGRLVGSSTRSYYGCANQAGEDNRNVARMALLLAGLPDTVPGVTVNRLCASGLDAVGTAAQAIRAGEIDFAIAGGVESMTRAPFVMGKAQEAFQRSAQIYDTTIGWRFVNPLMKQQYGVDSMPETARERGRGIPGRAQGSGRVRAALAAARRARRRPRGFFAEEIVPVDVPDGKAGPMTVDKRRASAPRHHAGGARQAQGSVPRSRHRHRRQRLGRQRRRGRDDHRVGGRGEEARPHAARAHPRHGVGRRAAAHHGHRPGAGDAEADGAAGLKIGDFDVIELNEAFASQALACLRQLGLPDDAEHVNPNGGAIALGHPLGMSGARLALTAAHHLIKTGGKRALATMCVGVGQGVSLAIERVRMPSLVSHPRSGERTSRRWRSSRA